MLPLTLGNYDWKICTESTLDSVYKWTTQPKIFIIEHDNSPVDHHRLTIDTVRNNLAMFFVCSNPLSIHFGRWSVSTCGLIFQQNYYIDVGNCTETVKNEGWYSGMIDDLSLKNRILWVRNYESVFPVFLKTT